MARGAHFSSQSKPASRYVPTNDYVYDGTDEDEGFGASRPQSLLAGAILAAFFALVLEVLTVMGTRQGMPFDPSCWLPTRMLVFFCVLTPLTTCFIYRLTRWDRGIFEAIGIHALPYFLSVVAVLVGLASGIGLGVPLAIFAHDPGDNRFGLVVAALLCSIFLLAIHRKLVVRSPEWGFLILALSFGTCFCLLMPPNSEISWDGATHFKNANGLSYVFDAEYTGADQIMCQGGLEGSLYLTGDLSYTEQRWVEQDSRLVDFPHADLEDNVQADVRDTLRQAERSREVALCTGTEAWPSGDYWTFRSIGLIPNAIGLWLGRVLPMDPVGRYTMARLTSLFFYVIVFFFAVRALRRGKLIMCAIGLAPTSMLLAANFSYDPWTIAFCSLFAGRLVGTLQGDRKLDVWDSLSIAVPLVLGALVKAVLFPLCFLMLIIPKRRFKDSIEYLFHLAVVASALLVLVCSFVVPYLMPSGSVEAQADDRGGSEVSVTGQMAYVKEHPLETLQMSVRFAFGMLNPLDLGLASSQSDENLLYYFPYLIATDAPLNEFLATLEYVLLLVVAFLDGGPEDEGYKGVMPKVVALVSVLLAFALISGALYASFTDVGRDTISGVQYRYLLPLLAPTLLIIPNTALRRREKGAWTSMAFCSIECLLLLLVTANSFVILF